jgi:hypothetical protein
MLSVAERARERKRGFTATAHRIVSFRVRFSFVDHSVCREWLHKRMNQHREKLTGAEDNHADERAFKFHRKLR